MIIELEINGARVIVSGENLSVSVTQDDKPVHHVVRPIETISSNDFPTGAQIKSLRKAMRKSQASFAKLLGVRQATICRWEREYERPSGPSAILLISMIKSGEVPA
ncbi:helix-turn-helix domain-containing protein [Sinorhizobium medicae]|uniref:helix-turn-helix domain-containing protein n=1 Tax=Sinorhizobium medicae TaxID=110321 RepID=UPI002AF6A69E|nr:helix-turn-helix domain-containing protein [Sinorhizobium medicae]WQO60285.1 helix-turn-helix domain-containing protein [Sinorhizobium medicae]